MDERLLFVRAPSRFSTVLTLSAAALLLLTGCASATAAMPSFDAPAAVSPTPTTPREAGSPPADPPSPPDPAASALLQQLPVKGKAPKTGYDRVGDFGTAWRDVDHNGCDTRNDVLARDLQAVTKSGPCKVLSGTLVDPYTATTIHFVRGNATSTAVQIDHVVALENAWQTGAQQLTPERRLALANDPMNLLAVDGPTNSAKGAGDAATWLPPNKAFRCAYVARQVSVKAAYGLWVTPAERDAIARILASCPGVTG
jgi:hypothetical protein